jgi:AcrR family transcriptional regulator
MSGIVDRRVQRTKRLLAEALIALVLERGYEAISIAEITERAHVGYATFFRHYDDKDALLHEVLEVVLGELLALLQQPEALGDPSVMGLVIFTYVGRNSQICRVLLGRQGSRALMQRMVAIGTQQALGRYGAHLSPSVPIEIAAHHIVVASIALIQWWLDHDLPYSPEQMAEIYRDLIAVPTERLLR